MPVLGPSSQPSPHPTASLPSIGDAELVFLEDNLDAMGRLPDACCDLIYADPPFNLNRRVGKAGVDAPGFSDRHDGGLQGYLTFLKPRFLEMHRLLGPTGSLYVHVDWHAGHYVKVLLDEIFGLDNFLNEIIWHYRTGGRPARWFMRKHDTILLYAKCVGRHTFHQQRGGTYRTDGLKSDADGRPFKTTRNGPLYFHSDGPAVTDVWDVPFLSTVGRERTGYPTQKPEALIERIIRASSNEGDTVADFFCGSGTTLAVAKRLGRRAIGCDNNAEAVSVTRRRLAALDRIQAR